MVALSSPSCAAVPGNESCVLSEAIIRCCREFVWKVLKELKRKKKKRTGKKRRLVRDLKILLESGQGHDALDVPGLGEEIETADGLHPVARQALGVAAI